MKVLTGKVISTKMAKTATVAVERIVAHPLYHKRYKRVKKYHVHDEVGAKVGQTVKFIASRPYSRLKRWKITGIVTNRRRATEQTLKKSQNPETKKGEKRKV